MLKVTTSVRSAVFQPIDTSVLPRVYCPVDNKIMLFEVRPEIHCFGVSSRYCSTVVMETARFKPICKLFTVVS